MKRITMCSFCGKEQKDAYKMIASPNGDAFICDDCVKICQDIIKDKENIENNFSLTKPIEIKSYLDRFIVGQEKAKIVLSVAVYNHYKKIRYNSKKDKEMFLDKSNILLCGPTGSGKTLLCKKIAEFLKVPYAEADATTLTEAGYVGDDVESVLYKLLQNADFDVKKAEKGIIYIDEIDKISKKVPSRNMPKDPTGEGVQQGLLKIMEGKVASVPLNKRAINQEFVTMDTSQILFICAGAFTGLEDIVNKRINKKNLGFENESDDKNILKEITPKDLIDFGMIPEFIGRLPVITNLEKLTITDLEKILLEPENSLTKQYKILFKEDGVDLVFDSSLLKIVAQKAYELNTGARGLKNVFENLMNDLMYILPNKKLDKFVLNDSFLNNNQINFLN